jgi:hypothetical protein
VVVDGVMTGDAETLEQHGAQLGELGGGPVAGSLSRDGDHVPDRSRFLSVRSPEKHDAVGEVEGFLDVVSDQQDGGRFGGVDLQQQVLHLEAGERVEGAERLVEQEHPWAAGKGAGEGDSLRHTAGDLSWSAPGGDVEADERQKLGDPTGPDLLRCASWQPECDVLGQGPPGQEAWLLEGDGAAVVDATGCQPVDQDLSGIRFVQPAREA